MTLKRIMKILYFWAMDHAILFTANLARVSNPTASYWFAKTRRVCSLASEKRKPFGGKNYIIEIDESLLHGKRKGNRGRYLRRDKWEVSFNKEFIQNGNNN